MSDYWQKRAIKAEKKVNDGAMQLEDVVAQAYRQAQSYFNRQISKLFNRVKQQTKLSEDDARELLNQTVSVEELVELKRLAKDITQPELQKQAQNRLTGLAVKSRITRVEELKAKSYLVSKQIADVQLQNQTDFYIDTIHGSYREATAETVIRKAIDDSKKGVITELWNKEGYKLKELSTPDTKLILGSHWKGSNYSERIWNDTDTLAKRLEELFTVESLTGMSEFEMAQTVAKEFNRSINVAERLIRTEANYMANQAKLKSWKDNGVKQYMIIAILDLRTSQICRNKDHKVYFVSEAIVNGAEGTYPPFHPWCRSVASYYSKRLNNTPRKAVDPITGKIFDIKGSTTYNEWMDILKSKYSQEELLLHKKKVSNYEKDKVQFNNLESTLRKENASHSLEEFQEIKYNNSKE